MKDIKARKAIMTMANSLSLSLSDIFIHWLNDYLFPAKKKCLKKRKPK